MAPGEVRSARSKILGFPRKGLPVAGSNSISSMPVQKLPKESQWRPLLSTSRSGSMALKASLELESEDQAFVHPAESGI